LERWFAKIRGKDFLRLSAQERIERLNVRCRNALLAFSEKAQRDALKSR